jgi:hypothetical protein
VLAPFLAATRMFLCFQALPAIAAGTIKSISAKNNGLCISQEIMYKLKKFGIRICILSINEPVRGYVD